MPILINGAEAISEDMSRVYGFIGGCGQASAYVIAHIIAGEPLSIDELTSIIKESIDAGYAQPWGSTPIASKWVLNKFGIESHIMNVQHNVLSSFIDKEIRSGIPVEIGIKQGHFLTDEQSNLHGHYVTIVGENDNGSFITADPNSPEAKSGKFTTNTINQLLAADPFAEIIPTHGVGTGGNINPGGGGGGLNPFDIAGAIKNLADTIGNIPNIFTKSISDAIKGAIANTEKALGFKGSQDIFWRITFIVVGLAVVLFALIMFAKDVGGTEQDHAEKAAGAIAPFAAAG